ncbi:MAG: flagellar hook-basal body complex protein FliE [Phycisphaerae bacterium]|nr:flagellar hook-basal body complex protein FliE [Phycisphaerae bacterium]
MAELGGINGLHASLWSHVAQPATQPTAAQNAGEFVGLLKDGLEKVEMDQSKQALAIEDLVTGRTQDVLPVVQAVADADLSFKLLLGVRNKMVDAYKQTMTMQV